MKSPVLEPKIALGKAQVGGKQYWIPLAWKENNGILIAGQSGSGKSQTASFYLNQYAYQGTQLIICDFDSPDEEEEALSERIDHLRGAFYLPVAKKPEDIQNRLKILNAEYERRRNDVTRRFPLMLVIDEVSAFLSHIKEDNSNAIENFAQKLLLMRKVGIRSMIIGQEWSSGFSTQLMRPIRSAFRVKIIHKLDAANTKMLLDFPTSQLVRDIGALNTGEVYYNGAKLRVPLLDSVDMIRAEQKITEYDFYTGNTFSNTSAPEVNEAWEETWLEGMFSTYGKSAGYAAAGFDPTNTKELIRFWLRRGHSKTMITEKLVRGSAERLRKLYDEVIEEESESR